MTTDKAAAPVGEFVLVPKAPTDAMIEAAERMADDIPLSDWGKVVHATPAQTYVAMIAAAPVSDNQTPPEILAGRLIDAWCDAKGGKIPWNKAIEIVCIITKLPEPERLRLLALGDEDKLFDTDIDIMRDVYMTNTQRSAYERILKAARK